MESESGRMKISKSKYEDASKAIYKAWEWMIEHPKLIYSALLLVIIIPPLVHAII